MKNITKNKFFLLGIMLFASATSVSIDAKEVQEENKESLVSQMLGYYYFDNKLKKPAFIGMAAYNSGELSLDTEGLSSEEKNIKSARWLGSIEIEKEDNYFFSVSDNKSVTLMINEEKVIYNEESKSLFLKKGFHDIEIICESDFSNNSTLSLEFTVTAENGNKNFNQIILFPPEFSSDDRSKKIIPEIGIKKNARRDSSYIDSDDDGIFDDWEVNGYTVVNRIVKPWDESLEDSGYKKYISNPNHAHTSRDPYTDLEKVLGDVDEGMSWEARDPMVAAVPAISVGMEKIILSKNITTGNEEGNTASREVGSSTVSSNTEGIDASVSIAWPPSASVTGHFSHTSSQSVDVKSNNGESLSSSISLNQGETANLNATIRYYNNGTGVIYDLKPTVNFILGKDTISTISSQNNQMASSLSPKSTYPDRRLNGISLNTLDEFSSRLIPLNYEQVRSIDTGQKLRIETTQFSGQFVKRSSTGGTIYGGSWDMYLPQIRSTTAGITLDVGDGESIERRIATKNSKDPNDRTPVLTLKDAIMKGFDLNNNDTDLTYTSLNDNKSLSLDESKVYFIMDTQTQRELERQKKENKIENIYDAKIFPEMNVHIIPKELIGELVQSVYNSKSITKISDKKYDLVHSVQFHNAAFWDLTKVNNYQTSVTTDGKNFTGKVSAKKARNMGFITESPESKTGIKMELVVFGLFGVGNVPSATTSQGGAIIIDKGSNIELFAELETGEVIKILSMDQ